ncbi:carbohydrate kinase [Gordonia sp. HNM0687]|uniref:Carbohydrate kinase n=1 Tax=Gordonia mangrovi TaxID=2665643 RepID=A0A6L7GTE0_9ACTN|nr:carbohydrate kinase [Gordonia mangrovi]MXP22707.1 carbohydrate kinase [Gordonia mangrovi]UVF77028.1 carbohydrate kinase [Gordonia mangrovi]
MREIVVCGEALVDVVQKSASPAASGVLAPLQPALGGGPFNVAVTLGRLGSAVSLCSAVSTDTYGEAIVSALQSAGVGTTLLQRRSEPTSLALATIGPDGGAHYSFYVEGTADRQVGDPGPFASTVAAVCFGTLSMVLEPGASVYESLLRRSRDEGWLVVVDPNIRPVVIAEPDAYRRRFASWMSAVDIVKLSDEDSDWLSSGPDATTGDDWLAAGVSAIITTAGADGITVRTRHGEVSAPAPPTQVADTIGAGDSVVGGVLRYLDRIGALSPAAVSELDADQWRAVAEFAGQVAAVTVSRPGADPPWASELTSD